MRIATIEEFGRDVDQAILAMEEESVFLLEDGRVTHGMVSFEEYKRLMASDGHPT